MTTSMRVKRYQVKQQPERWQTSGVMRATVQAQIPERKKKRKENDSEWKRLVQERGKGARMQVYSTVVQQ